MSNLKFFGDSVSFFEKDKDARTLIPIKDITTIAPWTNDEVVYGATLKTKTGLSLSVHLNNDEYKKLFLLVTKVKA